MTDKTCSPDTFPDSSCRLFLDGPAGRLEVMASPPEPDAKPLKAVSIIAHPHPLFGGSMLNKVVHMLDKALREVGVHTVRFNFRGVGQSEGSYDNGIGETDDLLAVHDWVRRVLPDHTLWLAGFSFGSYVALRAANLLHPAVLISIAPPVERYDFTVLPHPDSPWLVVMGTEDDVVSPEAVFAYVKSTRPAPLLKTLPAGHFFHRKLLDLKRAVQEGLTELGLVPASAATPATPSAADDPDNRHT